MTAEEAIKKIDEVLSSDCHYDETLAYQLTSFDFEWLEKAKQALENQIHIKQYENRIELSKHAIGLDYKTPYKRHGKLFYKPYRNYYATVIEDKVWTELAANGYAEHDEPNEHGTIFWLTNKGLEWLGNELGIKIYEERR